MAMMPNRTKYRKVQKGRIRGRATRGHTVAFGDFGLQALDAGWISGRQIEAGRVAANRAAAEQSRKDALEVRRARGGGPARACGAPARARLVPAWPTCQRSLTRLVLTCWSRCKQEPAG